jgi:hypothetical protein
VAQDHAALNLVTFTNGSPGLQLLNVAQAGSLRSP